MELCEDQSQADSRQSSKFFYLAKRQIVPVMANMTIIGSLLYFVDYKIEMEVLIDFCQNPKFGLFQHLHSCFV